MKVELATTIIRFVMLLMVMFVAPTVKMYLETHAEDVRIKNLSKWAIIASSAAEKIKASDPDGTLRKKYASQFLYEVRNHMKLDFTDEEIDKVIDATVSDYNELWNSRERRKVSA